MDNPFKILAGKTIHDILLQNDNSALAIVVGENREYVMFNGISATEQSDIYFNHVEIPTSVKGEVIQDVVQAEWESRPQRAWDEYRNITLTTSKGDITIEIINSFNPNQDNDYGVIDMYYYDNVDEAQMSNITQHMHSLLESAHSTPKPRM